MQHSFTRKLLATSLLAVGSGVAVPAVAQSTSGAMALEEIVVTARRRKETLQDVPLTVNAVTAEQLENLNIRNLEDIQSLVAGLTLTEDSIDSNASLRGVRFDNFTGHAPTVEFYMNDAPVSSLTALQAMFDVGQVEVLRGPQGTLRGRSSPSGSITVTTRRPVLDAFEGYVDLTATDLDGRNVRAAVNVPVIEDVLAVRVAGFWEENDGNDIDNVFTGESSGYEGDGYRFSVGYQPTDNLSINLMHQRLEPTREEFTPVESANLARPGLPPSDIPISPGDRLAVQDVVEYSEQDLELTTLNVGWDIGDHQLNYAGQYNEQIIFKPNTTADVANAIDASQPAEWQGVGQRFLTESRGFSHELRLQSLDPLFDGKLDYVVGALYSEAQSTTDLLSPQLIQARFFGFPVAHIVFNAPVFVGGDPTVEESVFANFTWHITDATEISAGLRNIDIETSTYLEFNGATALDETNSFDDTIYSFSLKHDFSDDLMGYFSYGTSFRAGVNVVAGFSAQLSERQKKFINLPAEESESFEIGIKSRLLDDRLRLNVSAFHQTFDNYPYRPSQGQYFRNFSFEGFDPDTGAPILAASQSQANFVGAVPVDVNGVEIEANYLATDNLDLGVLFSYAKGEVDNGTIPCNDYLPNDGIPDSGDAVPTLDDIIAAAGDQNLTECTVSYRSNTTPLWTSTFTAEYRFELGDMGAYVRGLWTVYGDSDNDPVNQLDDVDSYNILNLYAGVRDPAGNWEAMLFVKNAADTEEVTRRDPLPGSQSFRIQNLDGAPSSSGNLVSDYRVIGITKPREFGINFRYNF